MRRIDKEKQEKNNNHYVGLTACSRPHRLNLLPAPVGRVSSLAVYMPENLSSDAYLQQMHGRFNVPQELPQRIDPRQAP
jgi:hypothetical protein